MFRRSLLWTAAAVLCLICVPAGAAEVDCDSVYCFRQEDFSQEAAVTGICLTDLPDRTLGRWSMPQTQVRFTGDDRDTAAIYRRFFLAFLSAGG